MKYVIEERRMRVDENFIAGQTERGTRWNSGEDDVKVDDNGEILREGEDIKTWVEYYDEFMFDQARKSNSDI